MNNLVNDINNNDNIIGIFYIVTGIYKQFFPKFLKTLHYTFPNKLKKLIVISDGLIEYNNMCVDNINIKVEEFINYPYPFININKLQIVLHYAKKYNIDSIVYFDAETYFFEKDENFYNNLLEKSKKQFVSLLPLYMYGRVLKDHIRDSNIWSMWAETNRYEDFGFFYKNNDYDTCKTDIWIQTSFFMCSSDILEKLNNKIMDLIGYNQRIMGCKLNASDEFYVNYLNLYYPELFYADYYAYNHEGDYIQENMFFCQKYYLPHSKEKPKFGNANCDFRMYMFNINDNDKINRFFIEHIRDFLLISCNSHTDNTANDKIFYNTIYLNDEWFTGEKNIILEPSFYTNNFIQLFDHFLDKNIYVGFINEINDISNNFDYDKFFYENYDYIEGYSFDDIKNMKFENIDMCCFSKKYIEAYFNNDMNFEPKIYKLN
jgi:hypothetical protein